MTSEAQADGGGLGRVSPWQAGRREKSEPPASCQGAESSGTLWCPRQAGLLVQGGWDRLIRGPSVPRQRGGFGVSHLRAGR